MEAGILAHVLHGQLVPGLVTGYGLVLGPVILEHAVDLFHLRDGRHIAQEDGHLEQCFQYHLAPAAQRKQAAHTAHDHRGQHREQQNGKQAAYHGSSAQQNILGLGAKVFAHPLFKGRFLLSRVIIVAHADLGGIHHVAIPCDQTFDHGNGPPHQRDPGPNAVGRGRLDLRLNGAVRLADCAADLLRPPHHDPLHQGLAAHTGFETFLVWLIHRVSYPRMVPQKAGLAGCCSECSLSVPQRYGQTLICDTTAGPG